MNTLPRFYFIIFCSLFCFSMSLHGDENREDFDLDDDGLIEISSLEDLDEIRNNLDGLPIDKHGTTLYGKSIGCPKHEDTSDLGCFGYELTGHLDFDTNGNGYIDENDEYWNDGDGFNPIGNSSKPFSKIFEGNGYVVRNLYIRKNNFFSTSVGLFGKAELAQIRNLGLYGKVEGQKLVGGLAGLVTNTKIESVFFSGKVSGSEFSGSIGGLIGQSENSKITGFMASGVVSGGRVGGLVGYAKCTAITNGYTTNTVNGQERAEGLSINSSSCGDEELVIDSYWLEETQVTSHTSVFGSPSTTSGTKVKTKELMCTLEGTIEICDDVVQKLYSYKRSDGLAYWDFGTDNQLPALMMGANSYRDSDNDGVPDKFDDFSDRFAASSDKDKDGAPDYWNTDCDDACIENSRLIYDAFPLVEQAALDADLDGKPDIWIDSCNDNNIDCEAITGLSLDLLPGDFDNDGLADNLDSDDDGNQVKDIDRDSDGLIEISTLEELDAIRYSLNGLGKKLSEDEQLNTSGCPPRVFDGHMKRLCIGYELINDLEFDTNSNGEVDEGDQYWNEGEGWRPIYSTEKGYTYFSAIFDGNNHAIRNLYLNPEGSSTGLFRGITNSVIRNLVIEGVATTSGFSLAQFASLLSASADNDNKISNVNALGKVSGGRYAGGLVGYLRGDLNITNSVVEVKITRSKELGGFVGRNDGRLTIKQSSANVDLRGYGSSNVGGFVGGIHYDSGRYTSGVAKISDSTASGVIENPAYSDNDSLNIGGFIGVIEYGTSSIENSYASISYSKDLIKIHKNNKTMYLDGLVGGKSEEKSVITDSYWVFDKSTFPEELNIDKTNAVNYTDLICSQNVTCGASISLESWDSNIWSFNNGFLPVLAVIDNDFLDTDGDGIIDSSDLYPNDTDNDGVDNNVDPNHALDNGVPTLLGVPLYDSRSGSLQNSGRFLYTKDYYYAHHSDFLGFDAASDNLSYEASYRGDLFTITRWGYKRFEFDSGRHVIKWVAIDEAGNRSEPIEQVIDIYPHVYAVNKTVEIGEPGLADIVIRLTGPSPIYPVSVQASFDLANSTLSDEDIDTESEYEFSVSDAVNIEIVSGQEDELNTTGHLFIPIGEDDQFDDYEDLSISLNGAGVEGIENTHFKVVEDKSKVKLTVIEGNLPPTLDFTVKQQDKIVDVINPANGLVKIQLKITDPNLRDTHRIYWDTSSISNLDNTRFRESAYIDPKAMFDGDYDIIVSVTDSEGAVVEKTLTITLQRQEKGGDLDNEPESPSGSKAEPDSGEENTGVGPVDLLLMLLLMVMVVLYRSDYARR